MGEGLAAREALAHGEKLEPFPIQVDALDRQERVERALGGVLGAIRGESGPPMSRLAGLSNLWLVD